MTDLEFVVKIIGTSPHDSSWTLPVYHVFKGVNTIQESLLRLEKPKVQYKSFFENNISESYNTHGTFLSFQFILSSILDFIDQVETNIANKEDKKYLFSNTTDRQKLRDFSLRSK